MLKNIFFRVSYPPVKNGSLNIPMKINILDLYILIINIYIVI